MKGLLLALSFSATALIAPLAEATTEDQIDERLQSVR